MAPKACALLMLSSCAIGGFPCPIYDDQIGSGRDSTPRVPAITTAMKHDDDSSSTFQRPAVRFSWRTVPIFFHADNFTGDFNEEALQQLARYPIVTLEKWMGSLASCKASGMTPCCGEGGECVGDTIVRNFKRLKAINANVSTVLYLNSVLNFPQYRLAQEMEANPDWWLRDTDGKLVTMYGDFGPVNMTVFDFSQAAVCEKFVNVCIDAVKTGHVDGCFVDRAIDGFPTNLGAEKQKAYDDGHAQILLDMQRQIAAISGGPLIANHAYDLSGIVNAAPLVGADRCPPLSVLTIIGRDIQTGWQGWNVSMAQLRESVANGKLVEAHSPCADGAMAGCVGEITDTLAAFLVVAGYHSYYGCGPWHCGVDAAANMTRCGDDPTTITQFFHEDYSKPLGDPLGDATWERSDLMVRKFAHGTTVRFNITTNKGDIECGSFDTWLLPSAAAFVPRPVRGTLAQVWSIPSGCPSGSRFWDKGSKGGTFWSNETLWAAYLRNRDADAALLKHSLGDSPNATVIAGFNLYLADASAWGATPPQRLSLALAHWRAHGVRVVLFLLDIEFFGDGTWAQTHDIVHDAKARAYVLQMMKAILGAEGVADAVDFVSTYWIGASRRCNGKATTCTEAEIGALIADLQGVSNQVAGATYLQHLDGPFWNAPGVNMSGYSAKSLAVAQGVMAESWCMGTLLPDARSLLAAGGATKDTLLLLNDVPDCDLDPVKKCSTGSLASDTSTWFGWLDELGLTDTWGVWQLVDGGVGDPNDYGDGTNDGTALTAKGQLHRARALKAHS